MMWRWFTLVFIATLLWQLPRQRTIIVVRERDGAAAPAVATAVRATAVNRTLIDLAVDDPLALTAGSRPVPFVYAGRALGYKLYAVRGESIVAELGLRTGDVVLGVCGRDLHDPALAEALHSADTITLELLRDGEPLELAYAVTD
jgi:type II secretory pathway component PulC